MSIKNKYVFDKIKYNTAKEMIHKAPGYTNYAKNLEQKFISQQKVQNIIQQ